MLQSKMSAMFFETQCTIQCMEPPIFRGHPHDSNLTLTLTLGLILTLNILGSRDVIGHVTVGLAVSGFLYGGLL